MSGALATPARAATLDRLEREPFDFVVIGGGISGAGIAREATLRGASVALLEARDYAAGTSSKSSKLIHGGLRYLAHGDVATVRKTALERKEIHRRAPHLAEPRWMLVPARSRAGLLKFRTGLGTYEKLGAVEAADRHRSWTGDELAHEEPLLDRERTPYACAYREYLTDDAHLVLANLRSAVGAGAAALNYAPVVEIAVEAARAVAVLARCAQSGREVRVRGRCIINAAGPWVEAVQRLEHADTKPLLHLSKGVHVILPAERLPVRHMLVLGTPDKRSVFVIRRDAGVYVGTTDTSYPAQVDSEPRAAREDVEYLLAPLKDALRIDPVGPDDVVGTWAGLRPLIAQPGKAPSEISRKDEIHVGPAGVVTLAGGKLTGYRPMAQDTLALAAEAAGIALAEPAADEAPLPGGDFDGDLAGLAAGLAARHTLAPRTAERLVRLYGTEAEDICRRGTEPLLPDAPVLASEVDWALEMEGATSVDDVLYRRLRCPLYVPQIRTDAVAPIGARLQARFGWSDAERLASEAVAHERLAAELAFREEEHP
jgi:glycerol-3-phosphate dehydrogenase